MMWLPDGRKSFKIGLAVLIQYRRVTDRHPATQPHCRSIYRAYYVARVKIIVRAYRLVHRFVHNWLKIKLLLFEVL